MSWPSSKMIRVFDTPSLTVDVQLVDIGERGHGVLDPARHVGLELAGVGARQVDRDRDLGRDEVGQLGDGQLAQADEARHAEDGEDQRGGDRIADAPE